MTPKACATPSRSGGLRASWPVLLGCFFLAILPACTPKPSLPAAPVRSAQELLRRGAFAPAIALLRPCLDQGGGSCAGQDRAQRLNDLGEASLGLGLFSDAQQAFSQAAQTAATPETKARALAGLGRALLWQERAAEAARRLGQGLDSLGQDVPLARTRMLLALGEVELAAPTPAQAAAHFAEARSLAGTAGDRLLALRATVLEAKARLLSRENGRAAAILPTADQAGQDLAQTHDAALALIELGQAWLTLSLSDPRQGKDAARQAGLAWEAATRLAEALGDRRALTYALGYQGEQAETLHRPQDALERLRRAAFIAREANMPEALFTWEWHRARLLAATGETEAARAAYADVIELHRQLRQEACDAPSAVNREVMSPELSDRLFREYADLLLRDAAERPDPERAQALSRVRDVLERFKSVEIQDYFKDACVTQYLLAKTRLEELSPKAAVLYPLVFPDRLELLLSHNTGMVAKRVPVDGTSLRRKVEEFRRSLEERHSQAYREKARELYRLLLAPVTADLDAIGADVLIVVPDGPLRMIPMAALRDEAGFLVERLAVVTTPGLELTDPRPLTLGGQKALLVGLSQARQGFAGLPKVEDELGGLRGMLPGTVLENESFRRANLENALARDTYGVIHIATHGEFRAEAAKSFLLTWDDRITMDELDQLLRLTRFRRQPVELLTLSACRTATGDERAALGLAGVAIKAGARSAVATLWSVNDAAASEIILEFYRQLDVPGTSKVQALRQAQLKALHDPRFRHPFYWAPFLLIGNWL